MRPHAPALLAAALVALASWPLAGMLQPGTDLDGAWQIGLGQAVHDGLGFGPDVVFTYGPLGFLHQPVLVYLWPARLAFAWTVLVQLALAATLIWGLAHALRSRLLAVLLAVPVASALASIPEVVISFGGAVALVAARPRGRAAQALALGLGALAGIELLAKLNTGVSVAALGAVALAAAPAPRRALLVPYAAGAAAALAAGWVGTGQSLGAIDDYLRGSYEVMAGYSAAMYLEQPMKEWQLWAAAGLAGAGLLVAWRAADALSRRARLGLLALWAVLAFTSFKASFVRHDVGHGKIYFAALLGGLVAFGWAPHRRQTAWLLGALFAATLLAAWTISPQRLLTPVARARSFADQARLLVDGSDTNAAIAGGRRARGAVEQFDGRFVSAIGRRTVHVEPSDAGLVWSQRLRWRPLPVFQNYSAYTTYLDERNAATARSPAGPDVIMREQAPVADGRNPAFEAPAATRAILCHFRTAQGPFGRWLMLERSAPRCGRERPLRTVVAKLGAPTPVPPAPDASSVVIVRIEGIGVSGLETLRSALYRALPRRILMDGGRTNRLIPGTAGDGLMLHVPARADYPAPFGLDQAAKTVAVTKSDQRGDVRLRFTAMSIR
ncbi:MAG: hypothetical protein QOC68_3297 [Solirubrobacteraceae bacterium]|nr:hypothetical protein [Solirubrobacteraceae bacterium]